MQMSVEQLLIILFRVTQGCIDHATWHDTSVEADSTHKPTNVAFHLGLIFASALAFASAHNTVFT